MEIAIPLYDRFTALDAVGPYEVLSRLPGARVRFIAHDAGPVHTALGLLEELGIGYDPQPPFHCGSPEKAGPELVALASRVLSDSAAVR